MFKKIKTGLGLEINDNCIKILKISLVKDEPILVKAEIILPVGVVQRGVIKNYQELARQLKKVFNKAKIPMRNQPVYFALPDNLLYIHIFKALIGEKQGIKELVAKEYQQNIPLSDDEGEFSFKILGDNNSLNREVTIFLVAAAKKSLLLWQNFLEAQNLQVEFFDIDVLAIFRAMFDRYPSQILGILDIKYGYSRFALFSQHGLIYEFSSPWGITKINQPILEDKPVDIDSAVKNLKIDLENENLNFLLTDLKKNIKYFQEHNKNIQIDKIFLSGDVSNINNLTEYLNSLDLDFDFVQGKSILKKTLNEKYFQVLGLTQRVFSHNWEKSDPFLPCIGHTYSLENEIKNSKQKFFIFFKKIKKYIFLFSLLLVFVIFIWWFMGAVQTSLDFEDREFTKPPFEQREQNTELIKTDSQVKIKKKIFLKVKKIGIPLNVRKGPGIKYPVIGQILPGSEQIFKQEQDGWYNIEWPKEESAWISRKYVDKN